MHRDVIDYYNRKANDWDSISSYAFGDEFFDREDIRRVLRVVDIKKGERILDAGCGTGRYAIEFARLGARVLAVDASEKMIAIAREKAADNGLDTGIEFLIADIEDMKPKGVDRVFFCKTFEHLSRPWMALEELSKRSDEVIIVAYNGSSLPGMIHNVIRRLSWLNESNLLKKLREVLRLDYVPLNYHPPINEFRENVKDSSLKIEPVFWFPPELYKIINSKTLLRFDDFLSRLFPGRATLIAVKIRSHAGDKKHRPV